MILFLDFDGVLHPDAAYLVQGRPVLRDDGELFMWAPLLVEVLTTCPHVRIVLSTSWVRELRFTRARSYFPEALRSRVIGATWHNHMNDQLEDSHWWNAATRYQQIRRYVNRAGFVHWIAVDDDGDGWSAADADKLILTGGQQGLSDHAVLMQLTEKLRKTDGNAPAA